MKKTFFLSLLAGVALLAGFSHAVTDTYTTVNCGFSSPTRLISAKAVFYSGNLPTCSPDSMKLVATLPNSTKLAYSPKSCSAGVHEFSVDAPVNGVYQLNASVFATTASCSVAALFFEQRPRLPETNFLLVVLVGVAALGFFRKRGPIN